MSGETEIWRPYIGEFLVSNHGRVRNRKTKRLRVLTLTNGYYAWVLRIDGKQCLRKVHRAVLETFVGPPRPGQVARHLNGDPLDNRLENLVWGTPKENYADSVRHGRHRLGERNGSVKINVDIVLAIRASSESCPSLARRYGVSAGCIQCVRKGLTWAWVK